METESNRQIVVIGGGFGGVYVARDLLKRGHQVTLINPSNSFIFTPLLHEVATGNLSPRDVTFEYSSFFGDGNFEFIRGRVDKIDRDQRTVHVDGEEVAYEWLVAATGAQTNFFGCEGADCVYTLKTVDDAMNLKRAVLKLSQGIKREATITIVGGGATGTELAGEMEQFLKAIEQYNPTMSCHLRVIDGDDALITFFPEKVQRYARRVLERNGVELRLGEFAKRVTADQIETSGGIYDSDLTVWVAGVKPNTELFEGDLLDEHEHVVVEDTLRIRGCEREFALGDIITKEKEQIPKLAQTAVNEAHVVARNIDALIRGREARATYTTKLKGKLISLGKWRGAGEIKGMVAKGPHMWILWRSVYFFKNPGWKNKFEVAFSWFTNMFTGRSLSEE